jgi:hypothetical protein
MKDGGSPISKERVIVKTQSKNTCNIWLKIIKAP